MKRCGICKDGAIELFGYLTRHNKELWGIDTENATQLDYCQAWEIPAKWRTIGEINTIEDIKLLQSYETIVAIYVVGSKHIIRLGKWSRTTSAQTTRWEKRLGI